MSELTGHGAIYIDADARPVKREVYRVAERHSLRVYVVSNSFIAVPRDPPGCCQRCMRPQSSEKSALMNNHISLEIASA
jgi:uncharacterized protein YaiI (UPF0178 family)